MVKDRIGIINVPLLISTQHFLSGIVPLHRVVVVHEKSWKVHNFKKTNIEICEEGDNLEKHNFDVNVKIILKEGVEGIKIMINLNFNLVDNTIGKIDSGNI